MTAAGVKPSAQPERKDNVPADSLELRAKPAPTTRINRKVLFVVVALGLFSSLVW